MSKYLSFLVFIIFTLPICEKSYASHIVGGEINYKCLSGGYFEIIMTVYRDCFIGNPVVWFDNPAYIGFFSQDDIFITQLEMPLLNNDTLNPVLDNPCFAVPPFVCVHTTTYRDTIHLPFRVGGYQLAYQRCCRNQTILNLVQPEFTGATFYAYISEAALLECNTSALFNLWPPIFICVNEPIQFDHSAMDMDGDSLVYRLCTPLTGATPSQPQPRPPSAPPYDTVVWRLPYHLDNMLGGDFPLTIDSETGWLTGMPSVIGQFVVGVCVDEFRGGELISSTRRDFQYNVGECGEVIASFAYPEISCFHEVDFLNMSSEADSVLWLVDDPNIPGFSSTSFNLHYIFSEPGEYSVTLIANPGADCTDTLTQTIIILTMEPDFNFEVMQTNCTDSIEISLTALFDPDLIVNESFNWTINAGGQIFQFEGIDILVNVPRVSTIEIELKITDSNGCIYTLDKMFETQDLRLEPPVVSFEICPGESVILNPGPIPPNADFKWEPEIYLNDPTLLNPVSTPLIPTNYTFIASVPEGCSDTIEFEVLISPDVVISGIESDPEELFRGQSSQLTIEFNPEYSYSWTPSGSLDNPFVFNPLATPNQTTEYFVEVINSFGCSAVFSVIVVVIQVDCELPYVFIPNTFSPNGDGFNDTFNVESAILDEYILMVYNRWGQEVFRTNNQSNSWDGTFLNKEAPQDAYGYYFEGRCFSGESIQFKGSLTLIR